MQGDEPLVYPDMLDDAIALVGDGEDVKVRNLAKPIPDEDEYRDSKSVKVVVDKEWNALYFLQALTPYIHDGGYEDAPVYHQVCVIPFDREFLFEFTEILEIDLEQTESVDMPCLLENGYDVMLVEIHREISS